MQFGACVGIGVLLLENRFVYRSARKCWFAVLRAWLHKSIPSRWQGSVDAQLP